MSAARPLLCAAVAAALLAVGCGGDDEPSAGEDPTTETTAVETVPQTVPEPSAAEEAEAAAREKAAQERKERAEALRKERAADAKRAVKAIALTMDLETAAVATEKGGKRLTVTFEHQDACRMTEARVETFRTGVKTAAPRVGSVKLRGEESKKFTLERYKKENCPLRTARKPAPIVLDRVGSGDEFLQGPFQMTASPWTIEYETSAKRFRLVVIDQEDRTILSVGRPGGGLGEQLVRATGSFAIRVTSSGSWTVRLRNGT